MKPRTCVIHAWIANDKGEKAVYSLRPLPPAELAEAAAGFFLTNLSRDPSPVYAVTVEIGGIVCCNCPQHNRAGQCKHGDALLAAGVLPSALLAALRNRTKLLDEAEAMLKESEDKLAAVSERTVQLQTALAAIPPAKPKRRRPARPAEAA